MQKNYKKIHEICLSMLDRFIEVCDKYDLNWFADSGTLLGAIRDGKIIDWDDDIDIIMPREDYNKLLNVGAHEFNAPFFFQTPETDEVFDIHAKIRYNGTTALTEKEYTGSHHKGIFIDIFALDAVPNLKQVENEEVGFLRTIGRNATIRHHGQTHLTNNVKSDASTVFRVMNDIVTDITSQNEHSQYVGNVMFYRYSDFIGVRFNRSAYASYIEIPLEGLKHMLRIPKGYKEVLVAWYGESWSIEKRDASFHSYSFYDTENDYSVYNELTEKQFKKLCTL